MRNISWNQFPPRHGSTFTRIQFWRHKFLGRFFSSLFFRQSNIYTRPVHYRHLPCSGAGIAACRLKILQYGSSYRWGTYCAIMIVLPGFLRRCFVSFRAFVFAFAGSEKSNFSPCYPDPLTWSMSSQFFWVGGTFWLDNLCFFLFAFPASRMLYSGGGCVSRYDLIFCSPFPTHAARISVNFR